MRVCPKLGVLKIEYLRRALQPGRGARFCVDWRVGSSRVARQRRLHKLALQGSEAR